VYGTYLTRLTEVHRKFITKLRVNNIKFPIETGRCRNINREDRICQKCSLSLIGDEFHYLFVCNSHDILELRNKYIPNYFTTNASLEKISRMLSLCNVELLQKISIFIKCISGLFQ
jgi:hypothetical protein